MIAHLRIPPKSSSRHQERFCQPGKEHIPAAVEYFGCYITAVEPKGTNLFAYDLQDRELGKIVTQKSGTELLSAPKLTV